LPFLGDNEHDDPKCVKWKDYIFFNFIKKNKVKIDGVILGGNWSSFISIDHNKDSLCKSLKRVVGYLKSNDIPAIIIGQSERYHIPYPIIAAKLLESGIDNSDLYIKKEYGDINDFLKKNLTENYIDIYAISNKKISSKIEPYMIDSNHFSNFGAGSVVEKILHDSVFVKFLKQKIGD
jgi:hypothetical protein